MYNASIKKPVWLAAALYLSLLTGSALGEDITVSYAALTAAYMDHIVAIEKGYILEEGLNVKIMRAGGGTATQTLLSGQLHFSSSAGTALSAALRGGLVKIVYTNMSRPTYRLVSNKPEIRTLQDLVGKKIAINTFGDTGHLATLLLLKKYGLDTKSFLFIAVRNEARFPANVHDIKAGIRFLRAKAEEYGYRAGRIAKGAVMFSGNDVAALNDREMRDLRGR